MATGDARDGSIFETTTAIDAQKLERARRASIADTEDDPVGEPHLASLRARLAPLGRIPRLSASLSVLGDRIDDAQTAYVLAFVDGILSLESIVAAAGLPELLALRILDRALREGLLVVAPAPAPAGR
jgi:hypothetical protein